MANERQQVETILKLNVDYQESIKAVGNYINEIKKLKEEQSVLNAQLKYNQIGEKEYGAAMAANKATMTQLKGEMKSLTTEVRKKLESDRAAQKQIDINNDSYNKLAATYKLMKQRINEMSQAERAENKAYIDQSKAVYERMKTMQAETGKMQLNVGNYQAAITQAITGNNRFAQSLMNMSGGMNSMGTSMGFVNQNVMALGETFKLLLTNPVFWAFAGIAGAGMAFKWFKNYNEGLAEATRLTRQFTQLAGDELGQVRDMVQATADAFGKDFKEVMQSADALVGQYGITWKEAIDIINDGFAAGADLNGDMLATIKQYAPVLKDAGLSAEELVAVIQQTRSGVFGKDGLDAITKASKALRDMSRSTADSLRAVGINADELKTKLANGSITMMQAIQEVSAALKTVGANSQEAGAIIGDVFGKKGVAAGQEQLKAIADLNMELDDLIEKEGEYGKLQEQIAETQAIINQYTSALFGMEGWDVMKKKAELYGKVLLMNVLRNVVNVINSTIRLYNFSEKAFRVIATTVVTSVGVAWSAFRTFIKLVGDALSGLGKSLSGFGEMITGVFTFDAGKITNGWKTITSSLKGAWQSAVIDARNFGAAAGAAYSNGFNAALDSGGIGYLEVPEIGDGGTTSSGGVTPGGGSGSTTSSGSGGGTSSSSSNKAKTEKAAKDNAAAIEKAARLELALRQKLIQSRLAIIKKGSDEEMRLRLEALEQERLLAIDKINQEYKDVEDQEKVNELILNTTREFNAKRKAIYDEFAAAEQQRMEQEIANTFTARLMEASNNELEMERIKLEQAQQLRDNARQKEGETLEQWNARRLQLEQSYLDAKKALAAKEVEVQQAKYEAIATITGGLSGLLETIGEDNEKFAKLSKVLALAEIAINTGKAIAAGVASAMSVPFPGNLVAVATTVATVLANIATAISTVKSAQFAQGGFITGPGTGTSDSITAKVSNGESIMTANATAMFSPLLSALNQLGGGVPIVATGTTAQVGEDMLAAAIAKGYALAPAPVVSVKEITDVGNRVKVIEQMSKA